MKKTSLIMLSCIFMAAACAPQALLVESEMRGPSASGLNLSRKTMGIVYLYGTDARDSSFNRAFASGFASTLEKDYFGGNQEIDLYSIQYEKEADYTQKDSMVNLAMDVDRDVIFLIDKPGFGQVSYETTAKISDGSRRSSDSSYITPANIPFDTKIYVYDTQNKEDKVFGFAGNKTLEPSVYSNGKASGDQLDSLLWKNIAGVAESAGNLAAQSFVSRWENDEFYLIYYAGSEQAWISGAEHASSFKWKEALDDWIPLLKNKSNEKKACAAYNIGLACFMLGQPKLAIEWLDRSDSYEPVSLSTRLRQQIEYYSGIK